VDEAARTIMTLRDPTTTLSQISIALHRLAAGTLKLRGDPVAAGGCLAKYPRRMPGTTWTEWRANRLEQMRIHARVCASTGAQASSPARLD